MSATSTMSLPLGEQTRRRELTPASQEAPITRRAWFILPALLTMAVCCDPTRFFTHERYKQLPLLMMLTLFAYAFYSARFVLSQLSLPGWCFTLLLLLATPGLVLNKLDRADSSLFSAIGMLIIPITIYCMPARWFRIDQRQFLRWLWWIGAAFVVGSLFQIVLDKRGLATTRVHERAFLAPLAIVIPLVLRRYKAAALAIAGAGMILVLDPRTTLLIVLCFTGCLTAFLFFMGPVGRRMCALIFISLVIAIAAVGPSALRGVDQHFKSSVGMSDNGRFRAGLLETGIKIFKTSPFVGDFFRGGTSFSSGAFERDELGNWQEIHAPLHNDYLEFATKGGVIGAGLLISGLFATFVLAIRNYFILRASGRQEFACAQGVLAISIASLMFTILVNPVLNTPECGLPAFFLVSLVLFGDRYLRMNGLRRISMTQQRVPSSGGRAGQHD